LAGQLRLTEAKVTHAAQQLNLSRATLYRLIVRYRQRPQISSLLPWKRGRDLNTRLLDQERESLIRACIQDFYLTPERPTMAAFLRELRRRFAERSSPAPHYRTVCRRLEDINARLTLAKREGATAARDKFGPVRTSPLHNLLPLDVVQIDHTL
jgi:putative transposase